MRSLDSDLLHNTQNLKHDIGRYSCGWTRMVSHMELRQRQRIDKNTPKKESASVLSYLRCLLCGVQTICHVHDIQILGASDPHQVNFVVRKCDGEVSQKPNRVVQKISAEAESCNVKDIFGKM